MCIHIMFMGCRSEGPAQVFLLTLTWLMAAFGTHKREKWQDITVAYDNMCHLNNLKVTKQELPLPGQLRILLLLIDLLLR